MIMCHLTTDRFPLYCRECGCEIRCDDDLGYEDVEIEMRTSYAGSSETSIIEKPFFICRACQDEAGVIAFREECHER